MEIEELGNVSRSFPQQNEKVDKGVHKLPKKDKKDEVVLSSQGKKISEYVKIVKQVSTARKEKIKQVKEKLAKGKYNSNEVIDKTVEKLLNSGTLLSK